MGQNHNIDYHYLLNRLRSGTLSDTEKEDLQTYIRHTFKDESLNASMHDHWQDLKNKELIVDEMQLLILKNRILAKINQTATSPKKKSGLTVPHWKNYLLRTAAVLFIPLLITSLLLVNRMSRINNQLDQLTTNSDVQRVEANPGSRVHFTLPDHTEVWLNSDSKLEYPIALGLQSTRRVKLSGQGYFKVAHDAAHPFIVETDLLSIKALGTAFDVSGYADDQHISSTLEEGSIALIDHKGNEVTRIQPGQMAVLDKATNTLFVKDVDTRLSTSWKDGKLIFRDTPFPLVTMQLERWFNCNIHLDPNLLKSGLTYTATIQDETLIEVLKMMEISTKIKTKIEKREVYMNGRN